MDTNININELFPEIYDRYKLNNKVLDESLSQIFYLKQRDDYPLCIKMINNAVFNKLGVDLIDIQTRMTDKIDDIEDLDFYKITEQFLRDFYVFYRCVEQIIIDAYLVKTDSASLLRVVQNPVESEDDCPVIRLFTVNNKYLDISLHKNDFEFLEGILKELKENMKGDNNE